MTVTIFSVVIGNMLLVSVPIPTSPLPLFIIGFAVLFNRITIIKLLLIIYLFFVKKYICL